MDAAVKTDVDVFLRRGDANAQDFETLLQTVHRRALATASPSRQGDWPVAFVAALAAEIDALIGPRRSAAQDFEALGQALRRQALGLAAQAMAEYYDADHSDHSSSTVACARGQTAHLAGRRPKTFTTLPGPLTLHRAYYHCAACRRGGCPRDRPLGLQDTSLSPATVRLVGLAATSVSFAEASEWMAEPAGLAATPSRSSAPPKPWAARSRADERERVEPAPAAAPTMYLGLDGIGVPVRQSEIEGRRGKQPERLRQDPRGQARHRVDGGNT